MFSIFLFLEFKIRILRLVNFETVCEHISVFNCFDEAKLHGVKTSFFSDIYSSVLYLLIFFFQLDFLFLATIYLNS